MLLGSSQSFFEDESTAGQAKQQALCDGSGGTAQRDTRKDVAYRRPRGDPRSKRRVRKIDPHVGWIDQVLESYRKRIQGATLRKWRYTLHGPFQDPRPPVSNFIVLDFREPKENGTSVSNFIVLALFTLYLTLIDHQRLVNLAGI